MRAGKLDSTIEIVRVQWVDDGRGNVTEQEVAVATLRAQIVQQSTEEFIRTFGASDETVIIFRTRWLDGVTPSDKVRFDGTNFNLKEVKPIGRRRGLELRCINQ